MPIITFGTYRSIGIPGSLRMTAAMKVLGDISYLRRNYLVEDIIDDIGHRMWVVVARNRESPHPLISHWQNARHFRGVSSQLEPWR